MLHQLETVITVWPSIKNIFSVPHSKEEYENLVFLLDNLVDKVGEQENDPLSSLMETIGSLIELYENNHIDERRSSAADVLHYLMEEHQMRPADLIELGLGGQDFVAELLEGKKFLDTRQIRALSTRFKVSPVVFFQDTNPEGKTQMQQKLCDEIVDILKKHGGKAELFKIYQGVQKKFPNTSEESIRRTITRHSSASDSFDKTAPDLFYPVEGLGKGIWGLK